MKYYTIYAWAKCPFCVKAKALLKEKEVQTQYIVLDDAPDLLAHYKSIYNMRTVPIVRFVDEGLQIEKTIGGYTDLVEHFAKEAEQGVGGDD
jgi:glutaredoxin